MSSAPDWATLVLAPNPGPMTLTGTNTWVLSAPGADACAIVDPGPADARHLDAVLAVAAGREVRAVLLTHGHADHVDGLAALLERTGAPVPVTAEGSPLEVAGLRIDVLETPGHTADSRCFVVGETMLTGDTVLGAGTSVVAWPDGDLADYLSSLRRLSAMADGGAITRMLPGHGPVVDDPAAVCRHYLTHRLQRVDQVRRALADGADGPDDVVAQVYPELTGTLREAALRTVRATLVYLDGTPC
jgi:glyoxylase-like metal-dependent hydrolase (beta-lactamase superfamily II)